MLGSRRKQNLPALRGWRQHECDRETKRMALRPVRYLVRTRERRNGLHVRDRPHPERPD